MPQHVQLKFLFIKSLVSRQQQKMALELPLSSVPLLPFSNAAQAGILDLASSLHCSSITKSCIFCSLEHDSSIACHPMPCLPSTASCQCRGSDCLAAFLFPCLPLSGSLPMRRPVGSYTALVCKSQSRHYVPHGETPNGCPQGICAPAGQMATKQLR